MPNELTTQTGLTSYKPAGAKDLPDNAQWEMRFEIKSGSSNRVYTIARNKSTGLWGCSCPGYLSNRKCKHLIDGCGIPENKIHGRDGFLLKKTEKFS